MLLTGNAAVWWQGVKASITSWDDALSSLRSAFGDCRPPHRVYLELFKMSQGQREKTEIFVARARALLARLPPGDLSEKVQIDMLYGLLHRRVRKRLRRDEVTSYDTLLKKTRHIEDSIYETSPPEFIHHPQRATPRSSGSTVGEVPAGASTSARMTPRKIFNSGAAGGPPRDDSAAPSTVRVPAPRYTNTDNVSSTSIVKRLFCVYCKKYGHIRDECLKLASKTKFDNENTQAVSSRYGCGTKGVTRSQCTKCNASYYAVDAARTRSVTSDLPIGKVNTQLSSSVNSIHRDSSLHTACTSNTVKSSIYINNRKQCFVDNENNYYPTDFKAILPPRFFGTDNKVRLQNYSRLNHNINNNISSRNRPLMRYSSGTEPKHSYSEVPSGRDRVTMMNENRVTMENVGHFSTINSNVKSVAQSNSTEHQVRLRPILSVQMLGIRGNALLDTGAKSSVAGALLYELLLKHNHPCEETRRRVRLADGSARTRRVLLTTLEVRISPERSVTLEFTVFPDAQNNETLLGMDFLVAAGIVLDFASSTWHFSGKRVTYPIEYECPKPCMFASTADFLRDDKGSMLGSDERQQLSHLLQENGDIFRVGGAPTLYAEHHIDTGDHPPISVPPYRLTPVLQQRGEVLAIDLFGPLPEGEQGSDGYSW